MKACPSACNNQHRMTDLGCPRRTQYPRHNVCNVPSDSTLSTSHLSFPTHHLAILEGVCVCACACVYVCVCASVSVCARVSCLSMYLCKCMYACMYVCMYMCVYMCIYVSICVHNRHFPLCIYTVCVCMHNSPYMAHTFVHACVRGM